MDLPELNLLEVKAVLAHELVLLVGLCHCPLPAGIVPVVDRNRDVPGLGPFFPLLELSLLAGLAGLAFSVN